MVSGFLYFCLFLLSLFFSFKSLSTWGFYIYAVKIRERKNDKIHWRNLKSINLIFDQEQSQKPNSEKNNGFASLIRNAASLTATSSLSCKYSHLDTWQTMPDLRLLCALWHLGQSQPVNTIFSFVLWHLVFHHRY